MSEKAFIEYYFDLLSLRYREFHKYSDTFFDDNNTGWESIERDIMSILRQMYNFGKLRKEQKCLK